ncbi:hypothetical protein H5410_029710 [Solanum commersonii]|uniref:Uncharacterized protein n=1 Tax=Solanum commersonii TaxID=4109 RepID=A0A9J5YGH4_SOLCO|nr:hypothetical protein H5410_029710 [Solanum commersonii]
MARFGRKKSRIEKIQNKRQRNVKFAKSPSAMVIVNPPTNIDGTNSGLIVPPENATRKGKFRANPD